MFAAGDSERHEDEPEDDVSIIVESDSETDVYDSPVMLLNARRQRRNALAHIMDEDNEDVESDVDVEETGKKSSSLFCCYPTDWGTL